MLNAINNIRANGSFGPGNPAPSATAGGSGVGGPLQPLIWDVAAARAAQGWTNQCQFSHPTGNPYGQNLALQIPPATGTDAVTNWESEAADYTYHTPYGSCTDAQSNCGHYTQLVWRDTTAVGCAVTVCPTVNGFGGGPYAVEVCNFSPGGNYGDAGGTYAPY
jgi:pathogenesis-related protein 1